MEPSIFPIKFISLNNLIKEFKKNNYELIYEKSELKNKFKHYNFEKNLITKYLIFQKT